MGPHPVVAPGALVATGRAAVEEPTALAWAETGRLPGTLTGLGATLGILSITLLVGPLLDATLLGGGLLVALLFVLALLGLTLLDTLLLELRLVPVLHVARTGGWQPVGWTEVLDEGGLVLARGETGRVDVPARGARAALLVGAALGGGVGGEVVDVAHHHEGGDPHLLAGVDVGLHVLDQSIVLSVRILACAVSVGSLDVEGSLEGCHGAVVVGLRGTVLLGSSSVLLGGRDVAGTSAVPCVAKLGAVRRSGFVDVHRAHGVALDVLADLAVSNVLHVLCLSIHACLSLELQALGGAGLLAVCGGLGLAGFLSFADHPIAEVTSTTDRLLVVLVASVQLIREALEC